MDDGLAWQISVWDQMAEIYQQEIDGRFGPVIENLVGRANLKSGETVLDLSTGTGSVVIAAANAIGSEGRIIGIDISSAMLAKAQGRGQALALSNVKFGEGQAEEIPAEDGSLDAIPASLSLI